MKPFKFESEQVGATFEKAHAVINNANLIRNYYVPPTVEEGKKVPAMYRLDVTIQCFADTKAFNGGKQTVGSISKSYEVSEEDANKTPILKLAEKLVDEDKELTAIKK